MYSILSTPLISCSRGDATVAATVSALAPGYAAATEMLGGATSGYWDTGRPTYATAPTSMIRTEITPARIGRSMNSLEKPMVCSLPAGRRRADHGLLQAV